MIAKLEMKAPMCAGTRSRALVRQKGRRRLDDELASVESMGTHIARRFEGWRAPSLT